MNAARPLFIEILPDACPDSTRTTPKSWRVRGLQAPLARLERRVELYEGVGPQQSLGEIAEYLFLHSVILDSDKAAYIRAVVIDQSTA